MNLRYFTSEITLELDSEKCTGCGRCVEVCPHDVFQLVRIDAAPVSPCSCGGGTASRPRLRAAITGRERCMECGACALNCPFDAIRARAGVGCATAIINSMLKGGKPTCDCSDDQSVSVPTCRDRGCGSN